MSTDERMEKMEGQLARIRWFNRCLIACIVLSLGVWFIEESGAEPPTFKFTGGEMDLQALLDQNPQEKLHIDDAPRALEVTVIRQNSANQKQFSRGSRGFTEWGERHPQTLAD